MRMNPTSSLRGPRDHEAGFSLLELVVATAVLTIVMGTVFQLMGQTQASFDRNQLLAEAHQNADFAVLRTTEVIRGAGANPRNLSSINELTLISNKDYPGTGSVDPTLIRIIADLDSDQQIVSRVQSSGSQYYILSSEDVTLKYFAAETVSHGVTVPAHTICMIDNTPDNGFQPAQFVPVVLASNIIDFQCNIGSDPREVVITITAGPSQNIPTTDPRYVTFTRTSEIRLRNRI